MTFPVVGMVGGGQLARMTHEAGIPLGIRFKLLSDTPQDSAAQVVSDVVVGDYRDLDTLRAFARGCDVITFDHEHVPTEHLRALEADGIPVRPGPDALVHAQDKGVMRARLAEIGVPCPRHRIVTDPADVAAFAAEVGGFPVILKTVRGGYDGKGVWVVRSEEDAAEPFRAGVPVLAEEKVDFVRELAANIVRSPHGQAVAYPVVESDPGRRRLRHGHRPGPRAAARSSPARPSSWRCGSPPSSASSGTSRSSSSRPATAASSSTSSRCARTTPATGPRTARSPRSSPTTSGPSSTCRSATRARAPPGRSCANVLGGDYPDMYPAYLHCMARDPQLKIHMYGKDVKPGRKVGHVNTYGDDLADVRERARHAADYLRGTITE